MLHVINHMEQGMKKAKVSLAIINNFADLEDPRILLKTSHINRYNCDSDTCCSQHPRYKLISFRVKITIVSLKNL